MTTETRGQSRIWTCSVCKCEAVIPPDVPADAEIVCPVCPKLPVPAAPPATLIRRTKVAIVGFADSWPEAPFHNPDWEIWCLNQFYDLTGPKVDWKKLSEEGRLRWFDLHRRYDLENDPNVINRHPHHLKRLGEMTCPVYMHQHWDDIPASREYPLKAMIDKFGNYLTNSISYMMALAITEGFKEMGLYGVNMAQDCLHPDMRVLTADLRWIRAGDLELGQELLAFDEEVPTAPDGEPAQFRKYRKTTVESLSTIKRPCYRLYMADGSMLVASEGHQWLTLGMHTRNWMKTSQLRDRQLAPQRTSKIVKLLNVWGESHSRDAGYLAAAFDGEGHISQHKRETCESTSLTIGFAQKPNGMSAEVERCLTQYGFEYSKAEREDCGHYNLKGGRAELLRFLGTIRPPRLLDNFNVELVGCLNSIEDTPIVRKEFIGERETVGIRTGTQTLIVEGFASHNSEYAYQRPSCEYFVGLARGAGMTVHIPPQSDLLKAPYLYGYEDDKANAILAKIDQLLGEHSTKQAHHQRTADENTAYAQQFNGAIQQLQALKRIFVIGK